RRCWSSISRRTCSPVRGCRMRSRIAAGTAGNVVARRRSPALIATASSADVTAPGKTTTNAPRGVTRATRLPRSVCTATCVIAGRASPPHHGHRLKLRTLPTVLTRTTHVEIAGQRREIHAAAAAVDRVVAGAAGIRDAIPDPRAERGACVLRCVSPDQHSERQPAARVVGARLRARRARHGVRVHPGILGAVQQDARCGHTRRGREHDHQQ
ncbi:MAG: hypothetical protein QOJ63_696, partial [Solirubrobacteraceae bacterium]|nr:hypothetical protein [Solirubrobacteraceae bacterium]